MKTLTKLYKPLLNCNLFLLVVFLLTIIPSSIMGQNLKVMSFNMLEGGAEGRIDRIFEILSENNPDIVLAQETSTMDERFAVKAQEYGYYFIQQDLVKTTLQPAILSKYPITSTERHHQFVGAKIKLPNGNYVKAYSAHLPPLELNAERFYMLKQIARQFLRPDREKYPTIVGGDFNLWQNQTFELGALTDLGFTRDMADYLSYIYSHGFNSVANSGKVISGSNWPSDHDAIYLEYYMPDEFVEESESFTVYNKFDSTYLLSSNDFINHFPLGGLTGIKILELPQKGELTINDNIISEGEVISTTDLNNLEYSNNYLGLDEFEWQGITSSGQASVSSFLSIENRYAIGWIDKSECYFDSDFLVPGVDLYFGSDDYFTSTSDAKLVGGEFVKFPTYISYFGNSWDGVENGDLFSMRIDTLADLYLAYDNRNVQPPNWLKSNYTLTDITFVSNQHSYIVYKKRVEPGLLRFGENRMNWEQRGNVDHFILIVVPVNVNLQADLVSPEIGKYDLNTNVDLNWSSALEAVSYHLQVSTEVNFNNIVFESTSITGTSVTLNNLENGTVYYWRVKGQNNTAEGNWSETWYFATGLGDDAPEHRSSDLRVDEIIYVEDDDPVHSNANPSAYHITGKNLTVEAWAKISSYPEDGKHSTIIVRPYNGEPWEAYDLRVANFDNLEKPEIQALVSDGTPNWGFANWTSSIPLNEWMHIAMSYDGNLVKLFINGDLVSSGYFSESIGRGETGLYIGGTFDWVNFNGLIDEVRLWNVTRTGEEIKAYRYVRLNGGEQGLAGYWPMDEIETVNGIRVVKDKTVNQNNLRVGNLNLSDDTPMGSSNPTAVQYEGAQPVDFQLYQNYPNPFNPSTTIKFGLPVQSKVSLEIYNILGQRVASLINQELAAGFHQVKWNASRIASGIYFYSIMTPSFSETKKLILMR